MTTHEIVFLSIILIGQIATGGLLLLYSRREKSLWEREKDLLEERVRSAEQRWPSAEQLAAEVAIVRELADARERELQQRLAQKDEEHEEELQAELRKAQRLLKVAHGLQQEVRYYQQAAARVATAAEPLSPMLAMAAQAQPPGGGLAALASLAPEERTRRVAAMWKRVAERIKPHEPKADEPGEPPSEAPAP